MAAFKTPARLLVSSVSFENIRLTGTCKARFRKAKLAHCRHRQKQYRDDIINRTIHLPRKQYSVVKKKKKKREKDAEAFNPPAVRISWHLHTRS